MLLTSCGVVKVAPSKSAQETSSQVQAPSIGKKPQKAPQTSTPQSPLAGEWAVTAVNSQEIKVEGDNYPSVSFVPSEQLPGVVDIIAFNGCNYLNGSWKVDKNSVEPMSEMISTMKACADAPFEQAINTALGETLTFDITTQGSHKILSLYNALGNNVMTLRRHSLSQLQGPWKVTQIAGMPVTDAVDIEINIDAEQGTIHGNAGCNVLNGKILPTLEKPDGLEFRDLHTTRMTCPYIDTEQAFLVALEEVVTAKIDGSTLSLLNEEAQPIIVMTRLTQPN